VAQLHRLYPHLTSTFHAPDLDRDDALAGAEPAIVYEWDGCDLKPTALFYRTRLMPSKIYPFYRNPPERLEKSWGLRR